MTVVRNSTDRGRGCRNPETGSSTAVDAGETIDLPPQQAENMVEDHGWSYSDVDEPDHEGWGDADMEAASEPEPEDAEATEEGTSYTDWLEDRNNDEVAEDVQGFGEDDLDHLHGLLQAADRKGAQDAIQEHIDELEG